MYIELPDGTNRTLKFKEICFKDILSHPSVIHNSIFTFYIFLINSVVISHPGFLFHRHYLPHKQYLFVSAVIDQEGEGTG